MKIYVCIKVATQIDGDFVLVQTEAAFKDKPKAEAFFNQKVKQWDEVIDNVPYKCVRALHELDLQG